MGNTYKTVRIYVSTFNILNSFSNKKKKNKLSLTKAFQTIKPPRPAFYQQIPILLNSLHPVFYSSILSHYITINQQGKLWPQDKHSYDTDSQKGKKKADLYYIPFWPNA